MSGHLMIPDGETGFSCLDCGREPWMDTFANPCLGPHPALVDVMVKHHTRITWHDIAINAAVLAAFTALWAGCLGIGWAAWTLVR